MPILTQDIKLLKSAVMADTTDGGGQMTGVEVIDGQSNNLFPDTSAMDRAFGRVNMRKVFGVAHTTDTDTLLGAHAVITDAPDDPLVHCTLIKTAGWSDDRTAAKDAIEKYMVKGPKAPSRIYDTHYAGSLQLRLFTFVGAAFPAGGDAVVLVNPNASYQYVRILKVSITTQNIAVVENGVTLVLSAQVAVCDLGQALAMDFVGPPAQRVGITDANYALLYTTSIATGAKFYGAKPLGVAGEPGDLSIVTSGGIYTPVVPAATIESPIIDQFPLTGRSSIVSTAAAFTTLPAAASVALSPNSVVKLPTAIDPKSLSITHGAITFTDSAGLLYQGTTAVGTVDYIAGTVTLDTSSPSYGVATLTVTYKPASAVGASSHSASFLITAANQGLSYTNDFEPPPAKGSFTLSYMAQGRWYDLTDNLDGKLSGSDSAYGIGTINYASGSMAVTLGAIPDVGSPLIATWGDSASAKAIDTTLPLKASLVVPMVDNTSLSGIAVSWSRGGTNYTAVTDANGVLSGDATGSLIYGKLSIAPNVFPDGDVLVDANLAAVSETSVTVNGGGNYTLTGALPVVPGTFRAAVIATLPADIWTKGATGFNYNPVMSISDSGGIIYADGIPVGTINYTTGAVFIAASYTTSYYYLINGATGPWQAGVWSVAIKSGAVVLSQPITGVSYSSGAASTSSQTITPSTWQISLDTVNAELITTGLTFNLGGQLYSSKAGALSAGWNSATGVPTIGAAGSVSSDGVISITSLPTNGSNAVTWANVAVDVSANLVAGGVFRTSSAPLKTGVFQLQAVSNSGSGNDGGVLSGDFIGTVDYTRGVVTWTVAGDAVNPADLSYNAVFLQYLPLDASLLGIETARLPLDGKVPIYRSGDLIVVHNTLTTTLPNPLVKDTVYYLGRERLASVRVKDALGVVVPDTLYTALLNPGTFTVPAASDIAAYTQPLTVEHRIEDMLLCSVADISGKLTFTRSLTHDFPADTSFVSSAMPFGDLFARVYSLFEQGTWTSVWQDTLIGSTIIAQFNSAQYPIVVTNAGTIKERWLILFTNTTSFRIIGESVGEIGSGNTSTDAAPLNPATGVPYFSIPATGWGAGWATGNALRFNTDACGTPFWVVRTVLQGPASIDSDQFTLAFRGDVDRP